MAQIKDVIVRYLDLEEVFDTDLQLTLADIRGHFGVTAGSLKVDGRVKVVKIDVIVPPGTYTLDIPSRNTGSSSYAPQTQIPTPTTVPPGTFTLDIPSRNTGSSYVPQTQIPTPTTTPTVVLDLPSKNTGQIPTPITTPTPASNTTTPPSPIIAVPVSISTPSPTLNLPHDSIYERETFDISVVDTKSKIASLMGGKRELEESTHDKEAKKSRPNSPISDPLPTSTPSISASPTTPSILPTSTPTLADLMKQKANPLPKPFMETFSLPDLLTSAKDKKETKAKVSQADSSSNKENNVNYDWKTKINISTTTTTGTHSSLITSISSTSSKPTTPERKRQKNEIITKILAREADRKTLRETFMNVAQIKAELSEDSKSPMSSSQVLHLCEVSWFNKINDTKFNFDFPQVMDVQMLAEFKLLLTFPEW